MQPIEWLETFEKTSPWMSPTGGDAIPGFLNALDVSKYILSPYLQQQPIIVRVGLGLLVVDVIPLAIDVLVFRWLLRKFWGGGDDGLTSVMDQVQIAAALDDMVRASEAVAYFEKNRGQSLVARRSKALLSIFYGDFFGKGFASGLSPDVLLFQLFTKLGPAFEAVAIALVESRLIRSAEVSDFLLSSIPLPSVDAALGLLDTALRQSTTIKLDPKSPNVVAVTPLGIIFTATATATGGKVVAGLKPSAVDLKTCVVDLYIIRRLVQSFGSYPATSAKAQLVLPLIDAALDSTLQLNRIFAKAEPGATLAVAPFDAIY